jgi:hypothetical protein
LHIPLENAAGYADESGVPLLLSATVGYVILLLSFYKKLKVDT